VVERRSDQAPESAEHAERPGDRAHTAQDYPSISGESQASKQSSRAAEAPKGRAQESPWAERARERRVPELPCTGIPCKAAEGNGPAQQLAGHRSTKAAKVRTWPGASVVERPSGKALGKPSGHTEQAPKYSETIVEHENQAISARKQLFMHGRKHPNEHECIRIQTVKEASKQINQSTQ